MNVFATCVNIHHISWVLGWLHSRYVYAYRPERIVWIFIISVECLGDYTQGMYMLTGQRELCEYLPYQLSAWVITLKVCICLQASANCVNIHISWVLGWLHSRYVYAYRPERIVWIFTISVECLGDYTQGMYILTSQREFKHFWNSFKMCVTSACEENFSNSQEVCQCKWQFIIRDFQISNKESCWIMKLIKEPGSV